MVENVNTNNFKLLYEEQSINNFSYITMCAGRGKSKFSKVFIDEYVFSFIEGLIWDKYREYGSLDEVKISSNEWKRIVEGILVAKEKLSLSSGEEVKKILKFNIFNPANPISEIDDVLESFGTFLDEFSNWVLNSIQSEKYISIIR